MSESISHYSWAGEPLADDQIGLLAGICSTRAIRRYANEPVPEKDLRDILFGATRAPSGSNRQPFRFVVLTDSARARQAKALIGEAAVLATNPCCLPGGSSTRSAPRRRT